MSNTTGETTEKEISSYESNESDSASLFDNIFSLSVKRTRTILDLNNSFVFDAKCSFLNDEYISAEMNRDHINLKRKCDNNKKEINTLTLKDQTFLITSPKKNCTFKV
jgi:hypothetical protein